MNSSFISVSSPLALLLPLRLSPPTLPVSFHFTSVSSPFSWLLPFYLSLLPLHFCLLPLSLSSGWLIPPFSFVQDQELERKPETTALTTKIPVC